MNNHITQTVIIGLAAFAAAVLILLPCIGRKEKPAPRGIRNKKAWLLNIRTKWSD